MDATFLSHDKILALRLFRLGKLPPGTYSSQILVENGFPLLVYEFGYVDEAQALVPGALPRRRFASPWARFLPGRLRTLAIFLAMLPRLVVRFLLDGKPRLILAHGPQEQVLAAICSALFRVPFAVHVHEGADPDEKLTPLNRLLLRMEGMVLRQAAFLLFPEATRAALYRQRYALSCPTFLVFNTPRLRQRGPGIDLRAKLGLPADSLLMAYFGGIGSRNAIEEAIQALSGLPRLHFLLWGWSDEGYVEALKAAAKKAGVESRVHFLGEVEDKWECLDACDVGYCVYRPDSFRTRHMATASNKLTECMAAGLPVITSSNDDFKRLVSTYQVGTCAPDLTPQGLRDGLHSLIYDELGLKRKAEKALEAHRTWFHYEKQFAPVLEFFREKFGPVTARPEAPSAAQR